MRIWLIASVMYGSRLLGATIHGSSFDFGDEQFELTAVVARSASSIGTRLSDEQLLCYDGRIGTSDVTIGEGGVDGLAFVRNKDYLNVFSRRFTDGDHSVDGLVFREKGELEQTRWTVVLIIGPIVSDDAKIVAGLYLEVAGAHVVDVKYAFTRLGNRLWFHKPYKDGMFTPTRLSEGLPADALQSVLEKIGEATKGAERGG